MTNRQRAQIFHEMGKLLRAGVHLDRSVDLLLEQGPAAPVRSWLEGLKQGLAARLSVAEAVAKNGATRPLETSLLAAGEKGGRLENSFEHLASYYDLRQRSRDKAIGALIYPFILLHLGLFVPDFGGIMQGKGLGGLLPDFLNRLIIAWTLILAVGIAAKMALKAATTSTAIDGLLNSIPLVGGVRRHWALARFCQVFQTCLLAALRISDTLRLAGDASQSAVLEDAGKQAAAKVEKGEQLTPSMRGTGAFPITFMQSIATAEETGTLDIEMGRWAAAESELASQAQNRAAEWLPRIFYVIVVFYVAYRIVSGFASYFNGLNSMLGA
ncbi:type II secretory pathway component PulF [Roseimicrobium gellanilyticum]|uniref:Type II secretory pathway component PulF n=1 Tax=Roseimicrobium gellanilyticum TaxID=748857 RepID=A0A366HP38_9BACT|nr:type II secretion system F family protein [Roseimicrobium gellanilyticum]RBP45266.1 type II secretory pathway component PulF [Roseimicrobium gellanilyticum]